MGLRVVEILEAVLQPPQEDVGGGELHDRLLAELAPRAERLERLERRPRAQGRVAPAADQLEALRDEFDLADPARTELDVAGQVAACDLLPDLRVELAHRVDRAVVEVLTVHERMRDLGELRAHARIAPRDDARLDPGVALPFAALRDEVLLERLEAGSERPGIAPRAQPHVDAEDLAVRRRVGQRADHALPEPDEEFVVRESARCRAFVRVDEHQVDVGRHVELAPAELAHADDQQLLRAGRAGRRAVLGFHAHAVRVERRVEGHLGEVGHRAGDLRERREAGEVARGDPQHHACSEFAERAGKRSRLGRVTSGEERPHPGRSPARAVRRLDFVRELRPRSEQALREPRPAQRESGLHVGHNPMRQMKKRPRKGYSTIVSSRQRRARYGNCS
jgi:hypothetical protein